MNTFRKLLLLGATLLALVFSSNAAAGTLNCPYAFWQMGIPLPPVLELDPNAADGEVLWSGILTPTVVKPGTCSGDGEVAMMFEWASSAARPNIHYTHIPGVGVRLKTLYKNCPQEYWPTTCQSTYDPLKPEFRIEFELIKIGPISPKVISCCGSLAHWRVTVGTAYLHLVYAGTTSVILKRQPTCSFSSNGVVQASLGDVSAGSFKGVGSRSPERPFKIDLSCKGGDGVTPMDAYVTLTDATDPGNRSTVLTLSPDSGAQGLGVEVLSGTRVLGYGADSSELGNPGQWKAGPVSPGTSIFSIPLAARYVQTESVVTPGSGNARATFTMSYQ